MGESMCAASDSKTRRHDKNMTIQWHHPKTLSQLRVAMRALPNHGENMWRSASRDGSIPMPFVWWGRGALVYKCTPFCKRWVLVESRAAVPI